LQYLAHLGIAASGRQRHAFLQNGNGFVDVALAPGYTSFAEKCAVFGAFTLHNAVVLLCPLPLLEPLIHAARAKAGQIERHVAIAQGFEVRYQLTA
jgi:hypothetical protein